MHGKLKSNRRANRYGVGQVILCSQIRSDDGALEAEPRDKMSLFAAVGPVLSQNTTPSFFFSSLFASRPGTFFRASKS